MGFKSVVSQGIQRHLETMITFSKSGSSYIRSMYMWCILLCCLCCYIYSIIIIFLNSIIDIDCIEGYSVNLWFSRTLCSLEANESSM